MVHMGGRLFHHPLPHHALPPMRVTFMKFHVTTDGLVDIDNQGTIMDGFGGIVRFLITGKSEEGQRDRAQRTKVIRLLSNPRFPPPCPPHLLTTLGRNPSFEDSVLQKKPVSVPQKPFSCFGMVFRPILT